VAAVPVTASGTIGVLSLAAGEVLDAADALPSCDDCSAPCGCGLSFAGDRSCGGEDVAEDGVVVLSGSASFPPLGADEPPAAPPFPGALAAAPRLWVLPNAVFEESPMRD
jgi:hypothetical protein